MAANRSAAFLAGRDYGLDASNLSDTLALAAAGQYANKHDGNDVGLRVIIMSNFMAGWSEARGPFSAPTAQRNS